MSKFFIEENQISENSITITGGDVAHIVKVLRMKEGDKLLLCDGKGYDYTAEIVTLSSSQVLTKMLEKSPCKNEPKTKITLFQGLPKQGKMEWIIEKCTEIGVSDIVPIKTERSVVRLDDERSDKKLSRWQKTAQEAAKQCGRGVVPKVHAPISLKDLKKDNLPDFLLVPYEEEKSVSVKEAIQNMNAESAGIFIGPEGGFEAFEIDFLKELGAKSVTLGPRILRTETAGMVALSLLLYECNEMK